MTISQITKTNQLERPVEIKPTPEKKITSAGEVSPAEKRAEDSFDFARPAQPLAPVALFNEDQSGQWAENGQFKRIESILEEDLSGIYFNLSLQQQQEFKHKGEEITARIIKLLSKPKVKIQKIISLIRDWLKIIPGLNVFFLEQMAKIKADKIIKTGGEKN